MDNKKHAQSKQSGNVRCELAGAARLVQKMRELCSLTIEVSATPVRDSEDRNLHQHGADEFCWGDTTFRADGLSIGRDYLRIEGTTFSRGKLAPENLVLQETLGRGAFSVVRRALWQTDNSGSQSVAVKTCPILESSRNEHEMLLKELRALCTLSHESLVHLHGAFLHGDTITIVLEYMDRGSLDVWSRSKAPICSNLTAAVSYQILEGLSFLHDRLILHRDLKPANVLLSSSGTVKLCDFGLAALQSSGAADASLNTTVLGTRKFMAPERLRAQPYGRSSDIWSFGLILLECCSGHPPWNDVTSLVDLLVTVEETNVKELIPVPTEAGLEEMIVVSMQVNPAKRVPAKVLILSPWFHETHKIVDRVTATRVVRASLKNA